MKSILRVKLLVSSMYLPYITTNTCRTFKNARNPCSIISICFHVITNDIVSCLCLLMLYCYRTSIRLAYKEIDTELKKQDNEIKKMNPKKADQVDRLGMGGIGLGNK